MLRSFEVISVGRESLWTDQSSIKVLGLNPPITSDSSSFIFGAISLITSMKELLGLDPNLVFIIPNCTRMFDSCTNTPITPVVTLFCMLSRC